MGPFLLKPQQWDVPLLSPLTGPDEYFSLVTLNLTSVMKLYKDNFCQSLSFKCTYFAYSFRPLIIELQRKKQCFLCGQHLSQMSGIDVQFLHSAYRALW